MSGDVLCTRGAVKSDRCRFNSLALDKVVNIDVAMSIRVLKFQMHDLLKRFNFPWFKKYASVTTRNYVANSNSDVVTGCMALISLIRKSAAANINLGNNLYGRASDSKCLAVSGEPISQTAI